MKINKPNITEGEWIVSKSGNISFEKAVVSKNDGGSICHITDWSKSNLNAKAISAVPDIIDALIEAEEYLTIIVKSSGWNPDHDSCIKNIRNSLKKAGCTYEP